jgi:hypothetical protein
MRKDINVKKPFYNTVVCAFPSLGNELRGTPEDRQSGHMAVRFHPLTGASGSAMGRP